MTILRAESLMNDGTALVLYGVAVGVTVGEKVPDFGSVAGTFALAYLGGVAIGFAVAWIGVWARKRVSDPLLANTVMVVIPFAAFMGADLIGASGVLAVVTCGLVMSQVGPRVAQATMRHYSIPFWTLSTFWVNASLFVLVGIEGHRAVLNLTSVSLWTALVGVLLIWVVMLVVRFGFLVVTSYALRLIDRRPSQRLLRVSNRSRVVSAVAGFRGAVSLAAALAIPTTVGSGAAFPDRDLVVFVVAAVVATTLIVQGLALPHIVRWAQLPPDDQLEQERELAEREPIEAAIAALPRLGAEFGAEAGALARLRADYEEHLTFLAQDSPEAGEDEPAVVNAHNATTELTLALIGLKRETLLRLRDDARIDDTILREMQARLDIEELRLRRSELRQD
jgi:CPA1 family monovalent cation:H+ antiporter